MARARSRESPNRLPSRSVRAARSCSPRKPSLGPSAFMTTALAASHRPSGLGRCSGRGRLQASYDVVHGVANRLQIFEVLVVDAKADGPFADLFLERFHELDERQGIGVEVVGERRVLGDRGRVDLEDVGEAVADQLEHFLAAQRPALDVRLGWHGSSYKGGNSQIVVAICDNPSL